MTEDETEKMNETEPSDHINIINSFNVASKKYIRSDQEPAHTINEVSRISTKSRRVSRRRPKPVSQRATKCV